MFKRADRPNYWARFSIKGQGQIRIALGTADEAEAQRIAQKEYDRAIVRAEERLLAVRSSFEKVAREYIAELKAEVLAGTKMAYVERDYPPVIERYFIPYFGKRPIADRLPHEQAQMAQNLVVELACEACCRG